MPVATPVGGAWRARPPLNFRPNRGPKGRKKFFCYPPPPLNPRLSQGLDDRPGYAIEDGFGEWSQWSVVSTQGGLFISSPFKAGGGLIETVGLFNLQKTMVSVLTTTEKCRKKSVLHVQSCFLLIRPTDFVWLFLLPSPHDRILFE